jgi:alpha-L-fucosidase 2
MLPKVKNIFRMMRSITAINKINNYRRVLRSLLAVLPLLIISIKGNSQQIKSYGPGSKSAETKSAIGPLLDAYNVTWDTPGPSSSQSMPTGNGDIGLNVWVEPNGDLCFLVAKTDAWGAAAPGEKNPWISAGGILMKLGKVRVSVSPNPLLKSGAKFNQILRLHDNEIVVTEGAGEKAVELRVWVDANHPVIRVESKSARPVTVKVTLDNWRIGSTGGDTVLPKQANQVTWYHQNAGDADPHLRGIIFGGLIKGDGLVQKNDTTLQSGKAAKAQLITIHPLTTKGLSNREWLSQLGKQAQQADQLPLEQARQAHRQWWDQFWHRSWIFIKGDGLADSTTRGYVLQRFVTACAGRGAYPIKFNGSIFVVDNPRYQQNAKSQGRSIDADFREWGGQYWMQNTRAMYWPRLMAGDFDEMLPLFNMYKQILPDNAKQVKEFYHHGGAYFAETSPFWGGLLYMGPEVKENWTGHYFTPILELSMMMLDYYQYTGDQKFAKETLLPIASAGIQFFDQHFGRDAQGKLLLDPDNSIEMFWKVHNPAPDIAGLHAVISRLIALPDNLADAKTKADWQRVYNELPDLPVGEKDGKPVLLPYTGPQTAQGRNLENPELYAVYPFRIYGLGKPDLPLAINTFNVRKFKDKGCWVQDPIQAAMLGLADDAKTYVTFALTRKEPTLKFPAFWATGHDYAPDEDNGGNGENGLQQMLLQTDGKKIILLPAWPKGWSADFKLNAPYNTTVQGTVENGKITNLVITPASRMADVVDLTK